MEVKVRLTLDTAMTLRRAAPVHGIAALVRAEVLRLTPERILALECAEQGPRRVVTTLADDPAVIARATALQMKPSRLLRAGANALAERLTVAPAQLMVVGVTPTRSSRGTAR